jgi:hypothetical protein
MCVGAGVVVLEGQGFCVACKRRSSSASQTDLTFAPAPRIGRARTLTVNDVCFRAGTSRAREHKARQRRGGEDGEMAIGNGVSSKVILLEMGGEE